jgi:hypothetical protein
MDVEVTTSDTYYDVINPQGFDSNWTIVSGNATIIDGILEQDGTEESIIERYFDECPYDNDVLSITYVNHRSGSGTDFTIEYVNYDDTVLSSINMGVNLQEYAWLVKGSSCDNINKSKIRIILPAGYSIPMQDIKIRKYT